MNGAPAIEPDGTSSASANPPAGLDVGITPPGRGQHQVDAAADTLRRAFDRSFALPPPDTTREVEDLLLIRVAGDPYAIALRDIAGMVAAPKVVALPAATPDLLGLAGIRGAIVPVFGLASILGYGPVPESPRWMVLCGGEQPIALAFSDFERYLRLPKSCLHADESVRAPRQYVTRIARGTDPGVRAVISVALVAASIRKANRP